MAEESPETNLAQIVRLDDPSRILSELLKRGINGVDELTKICMDRSQNDEFRRLACVLLGRLHSRKAVDTLIDLFQEDKPHMILAASWALSKIGTRAATRRLIEVIRSSPFPLNRQAAVSVFRRVKDKRAVSVLIRTLLNSREVPSVRFEAADAMAGLSARRTLPALIEATKDANVEVRWAAANALVLLCYKVISPKYLAFDVSW